MDDRLWTSSAENLTQESLKSGINHWCSLAAGLLRIISRQVTTVSLQLSRVEQQICRNSWCPKLFKGSLSSSLSSDSVFRLVKKRRFTAFFCSLIKEKFCTSLAREQTKKAWFHLCNMKPLNWPARLKGTPQNWKRDCFIEDTLIPQWHKNISRIVDNCVFFAVHGSTLVGNWAVSNELLLDHHLRFRHSLPANSQWALKTKSINWSGCLVLEPDLGFFVSKNNKSSGSCQQASSLNPFQWSSIFQVHRVLFFAKRSVQRQRHRMANTTPTVATFVTMFNVGFPWKCSAELQW